MLCTLRIVIHYGQGNVLAEYVTIISPPAGDITQMLQMVQHLCNIIVSTLLLLLSLITVVFIY